METLKTALKTKFNLGKHSKLVTTKLYNKLVTTSPIKIAEEFSEEIQV